MVRVNVGIPVSELSNDELLAEHFSIAEIMSKRDIDVKIPKAMTAKNQDKFFLDKLSYLEKRFGQLYYEGRKRGLSMANLQALWKGIEPDYYMPKQKEIDLAWKLWKKN